MGRTLLVEVEGFVSPGMTVEAGEAVGHDVETAIHAAVPEARIVLWTPKSIAV
jgi:divalent metal cation (Fe/Co/Zn/Cd) transporter